MRSVSRGVGWLLAFLIVQISISVLLKTAAAYAQWRVGVTAVAAAFPVLSTYLLMRVFMLMNANLGQGLAVGIAYILSQTALILVTRTRPSPSQLIGAGFTALGLFLLALGTPN